MPLWVELLSFSCRFSPKNEHLSDNDSAISQINDDLSNRYTKSETNNLLNAKQNKLTTAQLNATNSGITSSSVSQITTNKNNLTNLMNKAGFINTDGFSFNYDSSLDMLALWWRKGTTIWSLNVYASNPTYKMIFLVSANNGSNWATLWEIRK